MKIQTIVCKSSARKLFVNRTELHKLANKFVSLHPSFATDTALTVAAAPGCDQDSWSPHLFLLFTQLEKSELKPEYPKSLMLITVPATLTICSASFCIYGFVCFLL